MKKDDGVGAYVRRVNEETLRYSQDLLSENERLRAELGQAQSERAAQREMLASAQQREAHLQSELATARASIESHESESRHLGREMSRIDEENRRFAQQFAVLEQQNNNLANLYVAAYRLHETLDRREVITVLLEILANLVGTEEVAIFELPRGARTLRVIASNGVDPETVSAVEVGQGLIGEAVASGHVYISDAGTPRGSQQLTACVPLRLGDTVTGAIAIYQLLPQKRGVEELDREIFDLLASHAATALFCSAANGRCGQQQTSAEDGQTTSSAREA